MNKFYGKEEQEKIKLLTNLIKGELPRRKENFDLTYNQKLFNLILPYLNYISFVADICINYLCVIDNWRVVLYCHDSWSEPCIPSHIFFPDLSINRTNSSLYKIESVKNELIEINTGKGKTINTGEGKLTDTGEGKIINIGEGKTINTGEGKVIDAGEGKIKINNKNSRDSKNNDADYKNDKTNYNNTNYNNTNYNKTNYNKTNYNKTNYNKTNYNNTNYDDGNSNVAGAYRNTIALHPQGEPINPIWENSKYYNSTKKCRDKICTMDLSLWLGGRYFNLTNLKIKLPDYLRSSLYDSDQELNLKVDCKDLKGNCEDKKVKCANKIWNDIYFERFTEFNNSNDNKERINEHKAKIQMNKIKIGRAELAGKKIIRLHFDLKSILTSQKSTSRWNVDFMNVGCYPRIVEMIMKAVEESKDKIPKTVLDRYLPKILIDRYLPKTVIDN